MEDVFFMMRFFSMSYDDAMNVPYRRRKMFIEKLIDNLPKKGKK